MLRHLSKQFKELKEMARNTSEMFSSKVFFNQKIRFEPIVNEDAETLVKFLSAHFIPDHALYRAYGSADICGSTPVDSENEKREFFLNEVFIHPALASKPNVSFKVVDETTGQIIGVSLAQMYSPDMLMESQTL